ncbi:hypothetical protein PNOK_0621900 [Pyrrhoderma noxium]|uniref:Uncharacterized protein n=1 Tax=Pyrrhoderma noxium TaxID=2282107 RepID=A0A286UDR3_9AGAM|nr:hypothetical protein PNOK_0621900 [Pyrrhoderma noxium]
MNEGIREKDRDQYPILKKWHIRSNNLSFTDKQYAHIRVISEYTKSEESMTPLSDQTTLSIKIQIRAKGHFRYLRNSDGVRHYNQKVSQLQRQNNGDYFIAGGAGSFFRYLGLTVVNLMF